MGIFLRHSWNVKPPRWGSFADVQYAIKVNSEKIYSVDPDDDVLVMPLFWGLPLLDYSGYNNHGTNHGATYKDGSLDFDGGDDYILIPNDIVNITSDFSIGLWTKIDSFATESTWQRRFIVVKHGTNYLDFSVHATGNKFNYRMGASELKKTVNGFNTDTWYYIFLVKESGSYSIYVNNQNEALEAGGIILNSNSNSYIGTGAYAGLKGRFNGLIDEVRISNVARTADQIALFHDLPWDLYRPVSRPVWSIPAAETGVQHFMLLGVG